VSEAILSVRAAILQTTAATLFLLAAQKVPAICSYEILKAPKAS
jgi:hypothetical protein